MGNSPVDRDANYMREMWGTTKLISDYGSMRPNSDFLDNLANHQHQKMLREISNDDLTPKKHDFETQNELHEKIRNDEDYDDWDYGTEPFYGKISG
jgi:phosphopantothenoylcysteine synthetase/decarboxylase